MRSLSPDKYIRYPGLLLLVFVSLHFVRAQPGAAGNKPVVEEVLRKVYPACIKLYGIDSLTGQQNSAQFSAVLVSAEGHILTAAHATKPGNLYKVLFPDGREGRARALGRMAFEQRTSRPDVAMMKMEGKGPWPYAEMGWSSSLFLGQRCFGVSYPQSLNLPYPMLRVGTVDDPLDQWGFIESSCIMETGDSGGPLFDMLGRVIGIHSRLQKPEGANMEVPVDTYRLYWDALQEAKDYKAFPEEESPLGIDDLVSEIQRLNVSDHGAASRLPYSDLSKSVLRISSVIDGKSVQILGTVFILPNGKRVVISKSSEVGAEPQLDTGKVPLYVLKRDRQLDLVVLSANGHDLSGIGLAEVSGSKSSKEELGESIVSVIRSAPFGKKGVVGMTTRVLNARFSSGGLGARLQEIGGLPTITGLDSLGPAVAAGLLPDDQIIGLNGEDVSSGRKINAAMPAYFAGDTVTLRYIRRQDTLSTALVLAQRDFKEPDHPMNRFTGGKSGRRDGFSAVFMHDSRIYAYECGSPVFTEDGRFLGINIARFSHTTCLALPAHAVIAFLESAGSP